MPMPRRAPQSQAHVPASGELPKLRAAALVPPLVKWFGQSRRDLPWREIDPATGLRNPYFSLVSELMLQQTQVSRVLEKFEPFVTRFPTVRALAAASEDDVLSAWTGLGYYRRARLLHAAAKAIVERHDGVVPRSVEALVALPGLGRYTAGAIASIAFHEPAPLVDTNVSRVMLRVGGVALAADDKTATAWVWEQAEALAKYAHARGEVAACNEALMELGALICTSEQPACLMCPLRDTCKARELGRQHDIPLPKKQAKRKPAAHTVAVLTLGAKVLVERRPSTGLWAGLWQALTIESEKPLSERNVRAQLALPKSITLQRRDDFVFQTTHRDITFRVFVGEVRESDVPQAADIIRRVVTREELASLGMSSPMRRILIEDMHIQTVQPAKLRATSKRPSRK
jgi:A/G-specific adenine glycosylase